MTRKKPITNKPRAPAQARAGAAQRTYGAGGKGKLFGKLEGTFVFRTGSKKPGAKQLKLSL